MTLSELRYLSTLATERHFGRAAQAAHVSQPALSAAIKHLEEELGTRLFERDASGVRLTQTGERVVAQARKVLDEADRVAILARKAPAPLTGRLRLGAISTLAPYAIATLIVPVLKQHPRLDLVLREGLTHELLAWLKLGEIDAAMIALPTDEPRLQALPKTS
jgi:LysR family hydrogen peroxide-inducible transcriptional activator